MGAWGFGLFQSDNDYDCVKIFDKAAGLDKLEEEQCGPSTEEPKSQTGLAIIQVNGCQYQGRFNGGHDDGPPRYTVPEPLTTRL
ncbi:hypothetical protein MBLNU230_g4568t1 [Neophaeotheca triangularis]